MPNKHALVMFSGGKDSLLTACRTIELGYDVHLVTFDNKRTAWLDVTKETVKLLKTRYKSHVLSHAIIETYDIIATLAEYYNSSTLHQIGSQYGLLKPYQVNCLHCHTAMYAKSIILCVQNKYPAIANGARFNQGFIVEHMQMLQEYTDLTDRYNIQLHCPVFSHDDIQRKMNLADRNILCNVLEPQCWVGCPCKEDLNKKEIRTYMRYYNDQIKDKVIEYIDSQIQDI